MKNQKKKKQEQKQQKNVSDRVYISVYAQTSHKAHLSNEII